MSEYTGDLTVEDFVKMGYAPIPRTDSTGKEIEPPEEDDQIISQGHVLEQEGPRNTGATLTQASPDAEEHIEEYVNYHPSQEDRRIRRYQAMVEMGKEQDQEFIDAVTEISEPEFVVPEGSFLLHSSSGDVYLQPDGITEKEEFVVLFFSDESALSFRPSISAKFLGVYDLDSGEQCVYHLFYSGILFQLPESERVAIIFHKMSIEGEW